MPTSKAEFMRLADARLAEASHLLSGGFYDGAFYLAGYAVEFGLKAVFCNRLNAFELPDPSIKDVFIHDLSKLLKQCDLTTDEMRRDNPRTVPYWNLTIRWNEAARYKAWGPSDANDILIAVGHPTDGVLEWLRSKW